MILPKYPGPVHRFLALVLFFGVALHPAAALAGEPTNAAEAVAVTTTADHQRIDRLYRQKKATLSPDRQAWENLLEQNLGDAFYLPRHKRDFVNGISSAWDFVVDDPKLPRVLLIGDSISRGYTLAVREALAGKANVHRAPENCGSTANGVKKCEVWLGQGRWDVIHFNFGIHDRATPPADYEARLEELSRRLLRTDARLIWASSTPLPAQSKYGSDAAIVERNAIAARVMASHGIAIDDLYASIAPRLADFQNANDVHYSDEGYKFLGRQVARAIVEALPAP